MCLGCMQGGPVQVMMQRIWVYILVSVFLWFWWLVATRRGTEVIVADALEEHEIPILSDTDHPIASQLLTLTPHTYLYRRQPRS